VSLSVAGFSIENSDVGAEHGNDTTFPDKYSPNIVLFRILNHLLRVLITATQNVERVIPEKKKI